MLNATERSCLISGLHVTAAEAAAIYEALGQFVENEECCDHYEDPERDSEHLVAARAVLERMDAALAELAERRLQ